MSKTSMSKTSITKSSMSKTSMSKSSMSKTSMTKTGITKSSITKTGMTKSSITKTGIANGSRQSSRCSNNWFNNSLTTNSTTCTNSIPSSGSSGKGDNWESTDKASLSLTLLTSIKSKTSIAKTSMSKSSITKTSMSKSGITKTSMSIMSKTVIPKTNTSITKSSWKGSSNNRGDGSSNSCYGSLASKSTTGTRSISSCGKGRDCNNWKSISSTVSKKKSSISIPLLAPIYS